MARKRRRSYSFMSEVPTNEAPIQPTQPPTQQCSQTSSQPHVEREEPHVEREEPQQLHSTSTINTPSGSTGPTTDDSSHKKGRGPAIGYQAKERINVMFNDYLQPIGDSSTDLMNVLGGIAKCGAHAPLHVVSWRQMPEPNLDIIWREIQHKTNAREEHKRACMKKVGELWKKWKHRVKERYFITNKDDAKKLLIPPTDTRVDPIYWPDLLDYWKLEKIEAEAERNSANRKQLEFPHRTGRTSHANIREEMKANNEDTSRANVFIKTRSKKDGTIPDDDTRSLVERITQKINEVPEENQTKAYKEQVFVDVMGTDGHGRVRTFGSGPSPREVFGPRSTLTSSSEEVENMAKKISEFENNQTIMLEQIKRMQHLLDAHGIIASSPRVDTNGSESSVG